MEKDTGGSTNKADDDKMVSTEISADPKPMERSGGAAKMSAESNGASNGPPTKKPSRRRQDRAESKLSLSLKDSLKSLKESHWLMGMNWMSPVPNRESEGNDPANEDGSNQDASSAKQKMRNNQDAQFDVDGKEEATERGDERLRLRTGRPCPRRQEALAPAEGCRSAGTILLPRGIAVVAEGDSAVDRDEVDALPAE